VRFEKTRITIFAELTLTARLAKFFWDQEMPTWEKNVPMWTPDQRGSFWGRVCKTGSGMLQPSKTVQLRQPTKENAKVSPRVFVEPQDRQEKKPGRSSPARQPAGWGAH